MALAGGKVTGALSVSIDPASIQPQFDAQEAAIEQARAAIVNRLDSLQIPPAEQIAPLLDALKSELLDSIPQADVAKFAQVRTDIAGLSNAVAQIKAMLTGVPAPVANIAPTVSLSATVLADTAPGVASLSIVAADQDGQISKIEIEQNASVVATLTSATNGVYLHSLTGLTAGSYDITAHAFDNASPPAVAATAAIRVVIKPAIGTPPAPGPSMPMTVSALTNPGDLMLLASPPTDGTIIKVEFYEGATLIATWEQMDGRALNVGVFHNKYSLTPGSYVFTSKAYAQNGTVYTSGPSPVTIGPRPVPVSPLTVYPITAPLPNAPVWAYAPLGDPGIPQNSPVLILPI